MDILQEYEKSQPKAPLPSTVQTPEQLLRQRYAPDTGFFIRLVMRLSGGRVRDARPASHVLLGVVIVIMVISFFVFISQGGSSSRLISGEVIYPQGEPPRLRTTDLP